MKIAVSACSRIPSETANSIQVMMACDALALNGHIVQVWVPGKGTVDFDALKEQYGLYSQPFKIQQLSSLKWLKRLDFSLAAVLRAIAWKAELIYTWTIQIAVIALALGLPVIYESHDLPVGRFGKHWFRLFTRLRGKKRVAFITQTLCEKVRAEYPALKKNECIIAPNGIHMEDYQSLPDKNIAKIALGLDPDSIVVSCSGHLYAGRGVSLFLQLAQTFPEVEFVWFGGQPNEVEKYRAEAALAGLSNVRFTGFIPKSALPSAQAASDILIMPYEASIAGSSGGNSAAICSPMKMFEYMALGCPILASDLLVIHEVLDESCAIFCTPNNLDSWREGLHRVIENPTQSQSIANEAKKRATQYDLQHRQEKIVCEMD